MGRAYVSPKLMVVHHTATDNVYADPTAEVRAIYVYHAVTRGGATSATTC